MHDDVSRVDQNPIAGLQTFDAGRTQAFVLQVGNEVFADRRDMTVRASGYDHHVVAQRRFSGNVDGDDVFCLRVLEACEDQLKGTGCSIGATFP